MPELPEVQTIVNDLNRKIIGRKIAAFWSDTPRIFRYTTINKIRRGIRGLKIQSINRHGKNIVFNLVKSHKLSVVSQKLLVIHPKLTGHLLIATRDMRHETWAKDKYIRALFELDNGEILAFSDVRKFGKIIFGDKNKVLALPDLKNLGPDALSVDFRAFKNAVSGERRKIKIVLLDQEVIAGIGNIYSDEALWMAEIHPFTPANKLTEKQLKALFLAIKRVLKQSLRVRGSSLRNYRDTEGKEGGYIKYRKVYDREGLPCFKCGTKIKRIKMNVRSAHYCPECQKL